MKKIQPFYSYLLSKIERVNLFSIDGNPAPHDNIHYQPSKNGITILTSDTIKISHELAHMIEVRDNGKLLENDYGIKKYYPKTAKGKLCAIARESRTRGIQTRLVELAVGQCRLLSFARSFPPLVLDTPSGRRVEYPTSHLDEWSRHLVASAYRSYSKERIIHIWEEKAQVLNNFINTESKRHHGS